MIRQHLLEKGVGASRSFRWRGGEITRFEGFTDAVFAFAVTLLVVSLEVPKTFDDLMVIMHGFLTFAICFTLLMTIWYEQYIFFRRYSLQDSYTIFLNAVLVFVTLFYVYPLKFMFSLLVNQMWGGVPHQLVDGVRVPVITAEQVPTLFIVFGAGYVAVFGVFALMFYHAYRKSATLELNKLEILDTRERIHTAIINICVGVISMTLAYFGGPRFSRFAGMVYAVLIPVLITSQKTLTGRRRRRLEEAMDAAGES